MDIMTAKVDKEIRNGANRAMNCDMANVNKTVDAALEQTAAISRLAESGRLALLPESCARRRSCGWTTPKCHCSN